MRPTIVELRGPSKLIPALPHKARKRFVDAICQILEPDCVARILFCRNTAFDKTEKGFVQVNVEPINNGVFVVDKTLSKLLELFDAEYVSVGMADEREHLIICIEEVDFGRKGRKTR